MLNQIGRAERTAGGEVALKGVSPLQREIDALQCALKEQMEAISSLRERLKPIYVDSPQVKQDQKEPPTSLSEMPSKVNDCRRIVEEHTALLAYLLSRIEV